MDFEIKKKIKKEIRRGANGRIYSRIFEKSTPFTFSFISMSC
jgi:hypothetical protein